MASSLLVAGLAAIFAAGTAAAAGPSITVSPASGLTNGASVAVNGTGFKPSQPGNVLECNNAPNEPTVTLGSPVNNAVPVGCTGPSFSASSLTSTSATGSVSKTYTVATGTLGPPCGAPTDAVNTCPATDSAGQNPKTDAANFPCPPTAAQQAAGVTCTITFGDQSGESAVATILFQGENAPTTTAAPVTTAGPVTTAVSVTTAPATSPALANTGPGPRLWLLLVGGLLLLVAAGILGLAGHRSLR